MKFKLVVLLFNAVVLLSVLILLLLPLIVIGPAFARDFWTDNWYLVLILGAVLLGLNGYFLWNRKVLGFLEAEDWAGLAEYLEKRLEKGPLGRSRLQLLMNSYLLQRRTDALRGLAERLESDYPTSFSSNAFQLAVAWLADSGQGRLGDAEGLLAFAERALQRDRVARPDWLHWDMALALAQLDRPADAGEEARRAGEQSGDPVVKGLSAYLAAHAAPEKTASWAWAQQARSDTAAMLTEAGWDKRVMRSRDNLQVLILQQMIKDAKEWVYAPD